MCMYMLFSFCKRQITFLQETMDKLEKRFRHEIITLQNDYESQIEKIKAEKIQIEMAYKEEIENLKVTLNFINSVDSNANSN